MVPLFSASARSCSFTQRTASGVDEDGVGLHLFQAGAALTSSRVESVRGQCRLMMSQLTKSSSSSRFFDFGRKLERRFGCVCMYFHAEADGDAGGVVAGLPKTDDTDFLATQFDERSVPEAEIGAVG